MEFLNRQVQLYYLLDLRRRPNVRRRLRGPRRRSGCKTDRIKDVLKDYERRQKVMGLLIHIRPTTNFPRSDARPGAAICSVHTELSTEAKGRQLGAERRAEWNPSRDSLFRRGRGGGGGEEWRRVGRGCE